MLDINSLEKLFWQKMVLEKNCIVLKCAGHNYVGRKTYLLQTDLLDMNVLARNILDINGWTEM